MSNSDEEVLTTTPFEESVLESLAQALREASLEPELVCIISDSYRAEKVPSADFLLKSIEKHSGGKTA